MRLPMEPAGRSRETASARRRAHLFTAGSMRRTRRDLRANEPARTRWRSAAVALGVVVALSAAMSAQGVQGSDGVGPATVSVSLAPGAPGNPVPRNFLGLSFELSSAAQIGQYANGGDFAHLLRSLGPGILRLGGASADTRVAWSDARTPIPSWASSVLVAGDLRRLRRLSAETGWKVLLTLGLAHYDPRAAAREATAARRILGSHLAGIEVGNEPDSYGRHEFRAQPWTAGMYESEVSVYRRAIARLGPGIPLAGPGVSGSRAFRSWGAAEARRQHPLLLTGHHYPLRCDSVPPPTIEQLLSERTRALEALSLSRYLAVAHARRTRFRMDEANTVSCGGRPGISDTFASALWAVGYITQAMAAGAAGINLQGAPANCLGYSPVCATTAAGLAAGQLQARPEWYALLMTSALIGDRPLRTRVIAPEKPNVAVSAWRAPGGALQFVIVEDDPAGAAGAALRLHVGRGARSASVLELSAPAPNSRSGVLLGGAAVRPDGAWQQPRRVRRVAVHHGVAALSVPAARAVLVTVAPRG